jgi:hypothetical protein
MTMKHLMITICIFCTVTAAAQIHVGDNKRYLVRKDGKPFFWLGDTNWELFHRLTREEAEELISVRSEQGFNVLQAVALAELEGIRKPNRYGDYPLNNEDPTQLAITPGNDPADPYAYDYWDHVDFVISKAASKGMYIGLLPTWGDKVTPMWGVGPRIFTIENAEVFGRTLATRYQNNWNVIWILGGDRGVVYKQKTEGVDKEQDDRPIWRAMAKGIEDVLGKDAFITYHPWGGSDRTSKTLHGEDWLDMNAFQSGHGARETEAWLWVKEDLEKTPPKPTLDMEPCYEDHPVNPWDGKWTRQRGYFNAYDVRARIYRTVFAGACGVTYGHHQIWQCYDPALFDPINIGDTVIGWKKALHAEAATQMKHLKNLMLSRPYFSRVADQTLIQSDPGKDYIDIILATRDENKRFAMIYIPQNRPVTVNLTRVSGSNKNVWWYNVRNGQAIREKSVSRKSTAKFTPPSTGQDWVLVIDDASMNYEAPGLVKD